MNNIKPEDDLLVDLNRIADFVIGNELPEEVGIGKYSTLPEILSHAICNSSDRRNLTAALNKVITLKELVLGLQNKIQVMITKFDLKQKNVKKFGNVKNIP